MISFIIIFNFLLYQPIIMIQRFEEITDIHIKKFKVKTSNEDLEMMLPIQYDRPESLSTNK